VNRDFHERGGVIRVNDFHPRRGQPASGLGIKLATGANALDTANAIRAELAKMEPILRHHVIAFATQLNFGDITQTNLGTILVHLQQDEV
jgi:multidrug efflux pump subunit AcrB